MPAELGKTSTEFAVLLIRDKLLWRAAMLTLAAELDSSIGCRNARVENSRLEYLSVREALWRKAAGTSVLRMFQIDTLCPERPGFTASGVGGKGGVF